MMFEKDFAGHDFVWFIGEVEARNDPLKLGRVRVRCFGWHPSSRDECPTKDLPWASTIQPVTAPPAPASGLTPGTWVFGFFMDGKKGQRPMVMGIIPGYRFNDDKENGESELPRAARCEPDYESSQSKLRRESRITNIGFDVSAASTWDEPEEPDDKEYPYVQTVSSEAGFITETILGPYETPDDFVGPPEPRSFTARQVTYDCVGGYEERRAPSGDKIVKVVGDNYEIIAGSSFVNIKGDIVMSVEGSVKHNISGDYELNVAGNMYTAIGGTDDKFVLGKGVYGYGQGKDTFIVLGGDKRTVGQGDILDVCILGNYNTAVTIGNHQTTVGGQHITAVAGASTLAVGGASTIAIGGTHTLAVTGASTTAVGGAHTMAITGASTVAVTGAHTAAYGNGSTQAYSRVTMSAGTGSIVLSSGTVSATTLLASSLVKGNLINGNLVRGSKVFQGSIGLGTHKHLGVTTGPGISGTPTP